MATMTFGNPNDNWRKRQNYYDRRKQEIGEVIKQIVKTLLVGLAFALLGWLLSGCTTTKYVPVIEHATDTLVQRVVERDSIHVHDSIRVTEKGDTVTIERWHTQFRDRWHHDSVYVARHDTIPQPYPVTEYVERKRTTFEWLLIIVGIAALFGGILWMANKVKKYLII
jgi:hypothetical protein